MKKIVLLCLCVLLAGCASLISCASTSATVMSADVAPIAFVSVMADNNIGWYGDSKQSRGLLGNLLEKAVNSETGENAQQLLPAAEKALKEAFSAKGIEIIDSSKILNSKTYMKASEDRLAKSSTVIVPSGYRYVTAKDSKFIQSLAAETGLKSGLYVNFIFEKNMSTGVMKNGVAKACVSATIVLIDTNGKAVINTKSYYASSDKTFTVVAGTYNVNDLMVLFADPIGKVCESIAASIQN